MAMPLSYYLYESLPRSIRVPIKIGASLFVSTAIDGAPAAALRRQMLIQWLLRIHRHNFDFSLIYKKIAKPRRLKMRMKKLTINIFFL